MVHVLYFLLWGEYICCVHRNDKLSHLHLSIVILTDSRQSSDPEIFKVTPLNTF